MKAEEVFKKLFGNGWYIALQQYLLSQEFFDLGTWLKEQRETRVIYPSHEEMFTAFNLTPFEEVKVVFLGLDPYIREGQALGVSFGIDINRTTGKIPPSLRTIHKELESDLDTVGVNFDYTLKGWAEQGVLMFNTALTVEQGVTGSHLLKWRNFTQCVLSALNEKNDNIIFILLGKEAQKYKKFLDPDKTLTIEAPHPAAEAYAGGKAGFYGSKIFSKCNAMLYMLGKKEIDWNIADKELS